jgi:hypothetical protein
MIDFLGEEVHVTIVDLGQHFRHKVREVVVGLAKVEPSDLIDQNQIGFRSFSGNGNNDLIEEHSVRKRFFNLACNPQLVSLMSICICVS